MRKKMIWVIGTLVAFSIVGLTVYQTNATSSSPDLNSEEIIELVNIQYPGQHSEPELSVENGEPVYQMEVTKDQGVYSLKLNGDTGQVIDLTSVEKTANNKEDTEEQEDAAEENPEADDSEPAEEKTESKSNNQTIENDAMLSHEEAKEIALKEFPGRVTDLELDSDDGVYIYEIEIVNGEEEASIEINAYTGNVVMIEIDIDD